MYFVQRSNYSLQQRNKFQTPVKNLTLQLHVREYYESEMKIRV